MVVDMKVMRRSFHNDNSSSVELIPTAGLRLYSVCPTGYEPFRYNFLGYQPVGSRYSSEQLMLGLALMETPSGWFNL